MFPSVFTDSTFKKKGKRLRRTFLTANTPPYGQPQNGQPQYNQPPQPQAPNYSQPQPGGLQYGQPQPPMPGNFPSQQAGAAAKNKPPVAIIIGAVAAVVVIALAAVFFLTNRVSRSDYEEALVQTQALESSYTAINEEFSSAASATDNDSSSAYDEGKKKLKTFKQDSDKLAAMKAVKKTRTSRRSTRRSSGTVRNTRGT